MAYESYDIRRKPFVADKERGKWLKSYDFILVCIALSFRMDTFSTIWMHASQMGLFAIFPYLLCLSFVVVPLMILQSFMGQFSSTGFISCLRMAPLFKGIGYVSLILNITTLTYYSIFAAVPFFYLINSIRLTLPWSCKAFAHWYDDKIVEEPQYNLCNLNSVDIEISVNNTFSNTFEIPSVLFFGKLFGDNFFGDGGFVMSWVLVACNIFIWSVVGYILYNFFNTPMLGKIFRGGLFIVFCLLNICLVRFLFLPGALNGLTHFMLPSYDDIVEGIPTVPLFVFSAFGPGWGLIITLASFNKFNTNVTRTSWIICIGQMFIYLILVLISFIIVHHFEYIGNIAGSIDSGTFVNDNYYWILYLSSGSALASMEFPQLWSILFYSMLIIAALIIMIVQCYSILVSLFDEFKILRWNKKAIILILTGSLAVTSNYSCSNMGIPHLSAISMDVLFTQIILNLLLLFMVLVIYGRKRFQNDLEFMIGAPFGIGNIYLLKFSAALGLIFVLFICSIIAFVEHLLTNINSLIMACVLILTVLLLIPGTCVYKTCFSSGSCITRLERTSRPNDWFPIEIEDRQRYEEEFGEPDVTYQLHEIEAFSAIQDTDENSESVHSFYV